MDCVSNFSIVLTLFRMHLFGAAHVCGGGAVKKAPFSKICHTYPAIMKLDTVIPYVKKIQENLNHVTYPFSFAGISIFSPEISKFCYIKKYRIHI